MICAMQELHTLCVYMCVCVCVCIMQLQLLTAESSATTPSNYWG